MPSESNEIISGSAVPVPPTSDPESVDVVLDFDAPSSPQEGGKDASGAQEPPDACRCVVGRRLAPSALAELDAALEGRGEGGQADGYGKLALRFDLSKDDVEGHAYGCLARRRGWKSLPLRKTVAPKVNYRTRASAKYAESRDQRVAYIARSLALGQDDGLDFYTTLSHTWGLSLAEVRELADAAHLMYQACRGDTSHERRRSVAFHDTVKKRATRVFNQAMKGVVAKIDSDGEPVHLVDLKAAAAAIGVAAKAQAAQDKATGVSTGGTLGAMFRTPEFQGLLGVILGALSTEDARTKVLVAVRRELDAKRAGAAFDDALRLLEVSTGEDAEDA